MVSWSMCHNEGRLYLILRLNEAGEQSKATVKDKLQSTTNNIGTVKLVFHNHFQYLAHDTLYSNACCSHEHTY